VRKPAKVLLAALLLLGARRAFAQPTSMSVSGNPGSLTITTAVAGSDPTSVSNSSTTYTTIKIKSNKPQKITAQIGSNMPANVTLTITLAAPAGSGTSVGPVALDITARNVVTNITGNYTAAITYLLSATPAAGVIATQTRVVTFTLSAWP
jgi:hypothetical protein